MSGRLRSPIETEVKEKDAEEEAEAEGKDQENFFHQISSQDRFVFFFL